MRTNISSRLGTETPLLKELIGDIKKRGDKNSTVSKKICVERRASD